MGPDRRRLLLVAALIGWWVATHPEVRSAIAAPAELRELTRPGGDYEAYYSSHPATSFAAQVWTNNAQAAALCLVLGAFLCLPVVAVLLLNMVNIGVGIGLMASAGRLDTFLGLLVPHGLLELTAVFVAMRHRPAPRLDRHRPRPTPPPRRPRPGRPRSPRHGPRPRPGPPGLRRHRSLRHPSGLPTWARITTGASAEAAFLVYVYAVGGRAARAGRTGDLAADETGSGVPVAT